MDNPKRNVNNLCNLKVVLKRLNPEKIVPLRGGVGFALIGKNPTCCSWQTVDGEHASFISSPRRSLRVAIAASCCLDFRAKPKLALKRLVGRNRSFSKQRKNRKHFGSNINEKLASRATCGIPEQGTISVEEKDALHPGVIVCTGICDSSLYLQTYSSAPITTLSSSTTDCTLYQGNTTTSPTGVASNMHQDKDNTTCTWTKGTAIEPIQTETETMRSPNISVTTSCVYQSIISTTEASQSLVELPTCTLSRPTSVPDLTLPYHILYQGTCVNTTAPSYKIVPYPLLSMGQSVGMTSPSNVYRTEMPAHTVQSINTVAGVGGDEMGACAASENILRDLLQPYKVPKMVPTKRHAVPIILARSRKLKTPVSCPAPNQSVSFPSVTTPTPLQQPAIQILSSPVHATQGSQLGGIVRLPVPLCMGRSVPLSVHHQQQTVPTVTALGEHDVRRALTSTVQSDSPCVCSVGLSLYHSPLVSNMKSNLFPQQIHQHQQLQFTVPGVTVLREQSKAKCLSSPVLSHTLSVDSIAAGPFHSPVTSNVNSSIARQPWWPQHANPSALVEPNVVLSYYPSVYSVGTTLLHSPSGYNVNRKNVWQLPQQPGQQQRGPILTQTLTRTLSSYTPSLYSLHSTLMHPPYESNITSNVAGQQHSAPSLAVSGEQSIRQSPHSPSICSVGTTQPHSPLVCNANINVARQQWPQQAALSMPVLGEQSTRQFTVSTVLSNSPPVYSVGTSLLHPLLVPNANIHVTRQQWPQQAAPSLAVLGAQSVRQALRNTVLSSNRSAYSTNTAQFHSPFLSNVNNSVARQQQQWQQHQHSQNTGNSGQGNTRPTFTNMSLSDKHVCSSSTGTSPLQMLLVSYDKPSLARQQQQQSMPNTAGFERQRSGRAVTSTVFSDSLSLCSVSTTPFSSHNVKSSGPRNQWQQYQPPRPSMVFSRDQSTGQAPTNTTFSYKHSVCSVGTASLNSLTVSNVSSSIPRCEQHKDSSTPATPVSIEQGKGRPAVLDTVFPGSVGTPLSHSSLVSTVNSSASRQQQQQQQQQSSQTKAVLMEQGPGGQALLHNISATKLRPLTVSSCNSCEQAAATTAVSRIQSMKQTLSSMPSCDNLSVSRVNTTAYLQSFSDVICVSSKKASCVSQTQQALRVMDHPHSGVNDSIGHWCSPKRAPESPTSISATNIEETFSISSLLPELTHDQDGTDESTCRDSFQTDYNSSHEINRTGAAANVAGCEEPSPQSANSLSAPTTAILKRMPSTSSAFDASTVGEATDPNPMEVNPVNLKQDTPVIVVSSCHANRSLEDSILQQNPTGNFHPNRPAASLPSITTKSSFALSTPYGFYTGREQHRHLTQAEAVSFVDLTGDNPEVTERNTATVASVHSTRDGSLVVVPSEEPLEFTANASFLSPSSKDLRLGHKSTRREVLTENKKDHATVLVTRLGEGKSDGGNNAAHISALVNSSQREDYERASFQRPLSVTLKNLIDGRPSQPGENTQTDREKQEKQLRTIDEICAELETVLIRVSSKNGTDFRWLVEDVKHSLQKEPAIETSDVLSSLRKLLQVKKSELESKRAQVRKSSEALRMLIINWKSELLCQESNYRATMAEKRKTDFQINSLSKRMRTSGLTMERWCTMMQEFNHRKEVLNKGRSLLKRKWTRPTGSS